MSVPRPTTELPPPSADRVLIMALVRAWLRTLPRKQRRDAVRYVSEILSLEIGDPNVVRLRPPAQDAEVMTARLQAEAFWAAALPMISSLLAEE